MKQILKRVLHLLLGEYAVYRIYTRPTAEAPAPRSGKSAGFAVREIGGAELLASPDQVIRDQAGYLGDDCCAFACFDGARIVGVCFYWFGARYRKRNFWPLAEREAKLVQVITLPDMRGREVAPTLVALSTHAMRDKGFERNFARIWHSNTPSLRAFARAGWSCVSTVVEINPLRRRRPLRIRLGG
ncbi:MAG: GNAT family N-acetyltransferase [Massilia sp.]